MIEVAEALERMLKHAIPRGAVGLPLLDAVGCHAAREVMATVALPGFDNSAMDGYAVRAAEAMRGSRLTVVDEQAAGPDRKLVLPNGAAIRIFTGAPVPDGADAVVMQEDVQREGDDIVVHDDVAAGQFIRRKGSDVCAGQVLIKRGDVVTPARAGLLASQGRVQVDVVAPPRAGVLSTGDELVPPGQHLNPGQIYNSNAVMLSAVLRESGVREVTALHCGDELTATKEALASLFDTCDIVLLSGGVSVGDHDQVKPALRELGFPIDLWRIKMKPGKPFVFASGEWRGEKKLVFGLPGNPVSAFVTLRVLVQPVLERLCGASLPASEMEVRVGEKITNDGDRPHYVRGRVEAGVFWPQGLQRSDALFGLSQSNALLRVEVGETVEAGAVRMVIG